VNIVEWLRKIGLDATTEREVDDMTHEDHPEAGIGDGMAPFRIKADWEPPSWAKPEAPRAEWMDGIDDGSKKKRGQE